MADRTYTQEEVQDLISVATLGQKLATVEGQYNVLVEKIEAAVKQEKIYTKSLRDSVTELKTKLDAGTENLHSCKASVENTLKEEYVTNAQLQIAMQEMQRNLERVITDSNNTLRKEFKDFGDAINTQVKANTDLLAKYRNYGAAGVSIALAVSWAVGLYLNTTKLQTTERVEASNSEVSTMLQELKRTQEVIGRQHQAIMKHQGLHDDHTE